MISLYSDNLISGFKTSKTSSKIVNSGISSFVNLLDSSPQQLPPEYPPVTFLSIAEKIEYIRKLDIENTSINHFHPQRLSQTYRLALRYEPYALRDFKDNKRYAFLVILLINLSKDLIDKAFDIHHRQMLNLFSKGRKTQEQIQQQNGKKLNEKVIHFASLGQLLIKAKQDGVDPFEALDKMFG